MTQIKKRKKRTINKGKTKNFSGQHLMHNKRLICEIIDQAKIDKHDLVLDLGAGKGALTSVLSKRAKKVLAVEYDSKFVAILKENFKDESNIKIIEQNILSLTLPRD